MLSASIGVGPQGDVTGKQGDVLVSLPLGTLFKLQKKITGEFKILWSLLTVARQIEPTTQTIMRSFFNQMNPSYIRKISGRRFFIQKLLNHGNLSC